MRNLLAIFYCAGSVLTAQAANTDQISNESITLETGTPPTLRRIPSIRAYPSTELVEIKLDTEDLDLDQRRGSLETHPGDIAQESSEESPKNSSAPELGIEIDADMEIEKEPRKRSLDPTSPHPHLVISDSAFLKYYNCFSTYSCFVGHKVFNVLSLGSGVAVAGCAVGNAIAPTEENRAFYASGILAFGVAYKGFSWLGKYAEHMVKEKEAEHEKYWADNPV
ncbi:MAG: hypothetical protein NTX76_02805 [Alphaproteobacteria bacterium]|nr:hypothetical protein [Alphaproteobacteria bacterium]